MTTNDNGHLPYSLEAEAAVIGSILIDPDAMLLAREASLAPRDFYSETNGMIYQAACDLATRFEVVDQLTIAETLSRRQHLDLIGGEAALTGLVLSTPTSIHAGYYAEIVHRLAIQRRLITTAGQIAVMASQHDGPIDALLASASRAFFETADVTEPQSHLYGSDDVLVDYLAHQEMRREQLAQNPHMLLRWGIPALDRLTGSFPQGYCVAVGARPGVGKTMLLEGLAEYNAARGHRVAFYHLELPHQMMLDRRMARYSGMDLESLKQGYCGPEVHRASEYLRSWQENIVYIHCPGWSAERIAADMARLTARGECELAIVDYLQKLAMPDLKGINMAVAVGQQMETLKTAAERLGVTVVVASQLNRSGTARDDKRPLLTDLRNSGEIEEKANMVLLLHRSQPRRDDDHLPTEEMEAYIEKNNAGGGGAVRLLHVRGRFTITEPEPTQDEEWFA